MVDKHDERIVVTLSKDEWREVVNAWVADRMSHESQLMFNESLAAGGSLEQACYDAMRNEAVNYILEEEMKLMKIGEVPEFQENDFNTSQPFKMIWVTFQKEGVHLYPAAASDPKLKTGSWDDVSFLGVPHRHIFHFRVSMEVFHDDRDVEFIQFKRWLERLYSEGTLNLNHKSCEMISDDLHAVIAAQYPGRKIIIEVSEDGENGSTAEYLA